MSRSQPILVLLGLILQGCVSLPSEPMDFGSIHAPVTAKRGQAATIEVSCIVPSGRFSPGNVSVGVNDVDRVVSISGILWQRVFPVTYDLAVVSVPRSVIFTPQNTGTYRIQAPMDGGWGAAKIDVVD